MGMDIRDYLTPTVLFIIVLLIISFMFIFPVLNMILLGAILAYGVRPIARKIQSKLKFESVSILIAMVIVIIPLILLIIYIALEMYGILSGFLATNSYEDIKAYLNSVAEFLPMAVDVNSVSASISSSLKEIGTYLLNYVGRFLGSLMNFTLDAFILFCSVFYFARDGDNCIEFIRSFVPSSSKGFFNKTIESVKGVLRSIFYGHFLTSLIIGICAAVGYSILGYPYGVFLGVMTGILQLIPVFGPWPIYWGLFAMDILGGNYPRAITVLLFEFFLSTIDMYIRPSLSSRYAEIHPLILLIGFLSGPLVYGVVGFIVGPLILGITYAVLDSYRNEYLIGEE